MSFLSDFSGIRCCSFPHGKKMPVILAIGLSLLGFIASCLLANEFAMGIGFMICLLIGLTSCMTMPPLALTIAAVAALANAGAHLTQAHSIYKARSSMNSMGGSAFCKSFQTMSDATANGYAPDDDGMYANYYHEFRKYCSNGVYVWHGMALLVWVLAGVVIFLIPSRTHHSQAALGNLDADDNDKEEPATEYQKQKDGAMELA